MAAEITDGDNSPKLSSLCLETDIFNYDRKAILVRAANTYGDLKREAAYGLRDLSSQSGWACLDSFCRLFPLYFYLLSSTRGLQKGWSEKLIVERF